MERMTPITRADVVAAIGHSSFRNGEDLAMAGQVMDVHRAPDGVITGKVRGTAQTPYRQAISARPRPDGKTGITGTCSCPVGFNCKHVAAVLLYWLDQQAPEADPVRLIAPPRPAALPVPETATLAMTPEVEAWLRGIEDAAQERRDDYPNSIRKRLLYVVQPRQGIVPLVDIVGIELRGDGQPTGKVTQYGLHQLVNPNQRPKFLRPADLPILRRLARDGGIDGDDGADTLRQILRTGRGRWGKVDGPALREGPAVPGAIAWRMAADGRQAPVLDLPHGLVPLHLAAPWYGDPKSGAVGLVEAGLPTRVLRAVLAAPALLPAAAAPVRAALAKRLPALPVTPPQEIAAARLVQEPLQPGLHLFAGQPPEPQYGYGWSPSARAAAATRPKVPLARVVFRYGPIDFPAAAPRDTLVRDGELLTILRDPQAERLALARVQKLGLRPVPRYYATSTNDPHAGELQMQDVDAWIDLMLDDVADLRRDGWDVQVSADFPVRIAEADGPIEAAVQEGSGIDWFDLDLGVMVDGQRVDLVPALMDMIASGMAEALLDGEDYEDTAPVLIPLPDGRLLALPQDRIRPILLPLLALFAGGVEDGKLRVSRFDAAELAALEEASAAAGVVWAGGDAVRDLGRLLRDAGGIPHVSVPDSFRAELRPYQAQGVDWMGFLGGAGLGGVLADDMGLGKTVQTLAHLVVEQAAGRLDRPALVLCPTSLVPNWRAEAARFAPTLRVLVLHGKDRAGSFDAIPAHDLVITTYPLLSRDHETLAAQDWHAVVLDEAQGIKNPAATTSKLARTLQARQRLCLSGTPLENHLGELWSLFDFLMPGFLGTRQAFTRRYRTPIEKGGDQAVQAQLARRVAPFLLRRTKAEVAADLPPKTDIAETVEMAAPQRAIYEGVRLAMHAKVRDAVAKRGLAQSGIIVLDAMLKLRQACCDPRLLKLGTAKAAKAGSAKLERLLELLPAMLEEGRRVLLFSQFTTMLALIQEDLERQRLPYVLLTGDTKDRTEPVRRFQAGEVPLFLISLKAGGVGLNLTAADTVIHYDPWWNPAVENQATDRAHRIGQDKPVFVHRLVTADSIEEKMELLKARKQALVDGILGAGPGATLGMTEADLEELLG